MKPRTPNHNALVSIIPFFGLTSFYYLGKKKGILSYCLMIAGSFSIAMTIAILGGIVMGIVINQLTLFMIIFPSQNILQYLIIKHFTMKRNLEMKKIER
jgi:hypothetical protein